MGTYWGGGGGGGCLFERLGACPRKFVVQCTYDQDWQDENQSWLFTRVAKIWIAMTEKQIQLMIIVVGAGLKPCTFPFWCTDHSPHCLYMTGIVKYDSLKFTNSWPGYCNSASCHFSYGPITVPLHKRDRPQHHGDFPPTLYEQWMKFIMYKGCETGSTVFSSSFKKTRKSNCIQPDVFIKAALPP